MTGFFEVIDIEEKITLDDGHLVRLKRKIGDGFTAVVFIAEPEDKTWRDEDLVVKIAKPSPEAEHYVSEEYSTLIDLKNRILEKGQPISPRVYGKGKYADRSLIAMELIKGAPIMGRDEVIRRNEKDALTIFSSIFSFMDRLHNIGVTYPDLKLDNFFWDETNPDAGIRVLDFGAMGTTFDPVNDRQCQREVQQIALGLFASLTGRYLLTNASGLVLENVSEVLTRYPISTGTKILLTKLLTKSKDFRITEAGKAKQELDLLLKFWSYDQEELFRKFHLNLIKGEEIVVDGDGQQTKDRFFDKKGCAVRAASAIDIYQLRFGRSEAVSDEINRKMQELNFATSFLSEAKRSLLKNDRETAISRLKEGESLSEKPEIFLLWQYIFEYAFLLPNEQIRKMLSSIEDVIDSFASDNLTAAILLLEEVRNDFPDFSPLNALSNYFNFVTSLHRSDQARANDEFDLAISEYRSAQKYLQTLPNEESLVTSYYPDFPNRLKILADESDQQAKDRLRPKISWAEALALAKAGKDKELNANFRKAVQFGRLSVDEQDVLARVLTEQLEASKLPEAMTLAELVNYIDEPTAKLVGIRERIRELARLKHAISLGDLPKATDLLASFANQDRDTKSFTQLISNFLNEFVKMDLVGLSDEKISLLLSLAQQSNNSLVYSQLTDIDMTRIDKNKKSVETALCQIELDLLPQEDWYLELDNFLDQLTTRPIATQIARIDTNLVHVKSVAKRVDFLKSSNIKDPEQKRRLDNLENEVKRRHAILSEQTVVMPIFKDTFQDYMTAASNRWKEFSRKYGLNSGEVAQIGANGSLDELKDEVFRIVKIMTEADRLFGNNEFFQSVASEVLLAYDLIGLPAWESLIKTDGQTPQDVRLVLNQVEEKISFGRIKEALHLLQALDAVRQLYPEALNLRVRLLKILSFSKQLDEYRELIMSSTYSEDLLQLIINGRKLQLPKGYYDSKGLPRYLTALIQKRRTKLKGSIGKLQSDISTNREPDQEAKDLLCEYVRLRNAMWAMEDARGMNDHG